MGKYTKQDKRMKDLEKRFTDIKLLPKVPAIIRIDGNAFHTYTKKIEKPFSHLLHEAMVYASIEVAKLISGVKAVYTQSDEISFWLSDDGHRDTIGWHDYKVQKMTSISASMFTEHFNDFMKPHVMKAAYFDSRVFSVPTEDDLHDYFWWRQKDATKNSVSMLAQHHFSHKSLQGLHGGQMQDKLMLEKEINWNDLDPWKKRGSLIVKVTSEKDVTYTDKRTGEEVTIEGVKRKSWQEVECPIFTQTSISEVVSKYANLNLEVDNPEESI